MNTESLKSMLEMVTQLATIVGIPVGIYVYFVNKQRERSGREYQVYNSLDDKYIDFLKLCIQYPELKVSTGQTEENNQWSEEQEYRRSALYEILISLFERAYLLYNDESDRIKKAQFKGWQEYIHDWMKSKSFRKYWWLLGTQFDKTFKDYMNKLAKEYGG